MNKNKLELSDFYIAGSLFLFTIWESLCGFILKFDAAARIPHVLLYSSLIVALLFGNGWQILKKYIWPLAAWLVLAVYNFTNVVIQTGSVIGFSSNAFFLWLFLAKLIYLMLLIIMLRRHERFTLKVLSLSIITISVLFLFFAEANIITINSVNVERYFGTNVINPNLVGFWNVLLLILAFYWLLKKPNQKLFGIFCGTLAITCVFLTASRTAGIPAAANILIAIYAYFRSKNFSKFKTLCCAALFVVFFAIIFPKITFFQNSTLVARMNYRQQEIAIFHLPENIFTKIMGERSIFFYEGYDFFRINPVFGIGFQNYIRYSEYGVRCHVEYIAQLVEGGLVGCFLYLVFLLSMALPMSEKKSASFENLFFYYAGLCSLLMYNAGSYTALKDCFYILCALVIVYKKQPKELPSTTDRSEAPTPDKELAHAHSFGNRQ